MYVVPFSMGPLGSPIAHIGVQLTDSAYVAVNMRIMTRMGQAVLDVLGADGEFVPCLHSVGYPLVARRRHHPRPTCRGRATPRTSTSSTSPRPARSGATAPATAATPCSARSASRCASPRRWPATTAGWPSTCSSSASRRPAGEKTYVAAAFPSACGKTNMAMMIPTLPGWKVETVGDDIAWMKFGDDGRLYAINPEAGFFGVAPGTGDDTNPNAMRHARRQLASSPTWPDRRRRRVVGGPHRRPPEHLIDWKGNDWTPDVRRARPPTPTPASPPRPSQCPSIAPEWEDPKGVPISAILFGGRRATNVPLVTESLRLAARRVPRLDHELGDHRGRRPARSASCASTPSPCCRSAATTWATTSPTGSRSASRRRPPSCPKLFWVNWFRKGDDGKFLWPGFGENSRVLKWVVERVAGDGDAVDTPIGRVPDRRRHRHRRASTSTTPTLDAAARRRRRRRGGPSCPRSRSTTRARRAAARQRCATSSTPSRSASPRSSHHAPRHLRQQVHRCRPSGRHRRVTHRVKATTGHELGCPPVTDAEAGVATAATDTQIAEPDDCRRGRGRRRRAAGRPPHRAGREPARRAHERLLPPRLRLVSLSFLMLFVELALIRWPGANVVYLSYFSNFVLLGSFLGIGLGLPVGRARRRPLFPFAPVVLGRARGVRRGSSRSTIDGRGGRADLLQRAVEPDGPCPARWCCRSSSSPWPSVDGLHRRRRGPDVRALRAARRLPVRPHRQRRSASSAFACCRSSAPARGVGPRRRRACCSSLPLRPRVRPRRRVARPLVAASSACSAGRVAGGRARDSDVVWSPYYKIEHDRSTTSGGVSTKVNESPHRHADPAPRATRSTSAIYRSADRARRRATCSSSAPAAGNDVAVALEPAAPPHVDAVEIDPRLYELGRGPPPRPAYDDPRVDVHIDDGRAFLERSDKK